MKQKLKIDVTQNNLVFGDCKDWLPYIDGKVDLIYIDPPFFSKKNYEVIWGNGYEKRSFDDRRKGEVNHYIGWMRDRLIEAKKVLSKEGSILLHCDYHANHHLRLLLDELFGEKNFINEIIWCYDVGGRSGNRFGRKHDTIYWYSNGKKYFFDKDNARKFGKPRKTGKESFGGIIKKNEEGRLYQAKKDRKTGKYYYYFLDENKIAEDWWAEINSIQSGDNERRGYPTQKPEKLLERLISCLSQEGDTVLDFFGGGGTTAKVCADLNRKFITGDVSPVAYRVMIDRLKEIDCYPIKVNPPLTRNEWLNIDDTDFEKKICMFQGWIHNPSSKPVDGWVDSGKTIPVEIKNHQSNIGVKDIRNLSGCMSAKGQTKGVFVAWHFSKGCFEYVAQLEKTEKKKIELVFAHTIIGDLVLTKEQREEYQALYEERIKESKQKARILHDPKPRKRALSKVI